MTVLAARECTDFPRSSWDDARLATLGHTVRLIEAMPGHPAVGARRAVGGSVEGRVCLLPTGEHLFYKDGGGSLGLYALRPPGEMEAVPLVGAGEIERFLETDVAVLEPGGPARAGRSRSEERSANRRLVTELSPLAFLSNQQLFELGVPRQLADAVRKVPAFEDLAALGLGEQVLRRLELQLVIDVPHGVEFHPEFLTYKVPDVDTLVRFYQGDLRRLLLNIEEGQERLIGMNTDGPVLVNGVAGSGKTTVALYRIRHLLLGQQSLTPRRILFLAYNRSLVQVARELLDDICETEGRLVEVATLHAWCVCYLKSLGRTPRILDDQREQETMLREAVQEVQAQGVSSQLFGRELSFWKEEIAQIVKGRCGCNPDEYLSVDRIGRGSALAPAPRGIVWRVYEAYARRLQERGYLDWEDVILEARAARRADPAFEPYDFVFVDEAQDLAPVSLNLIAQLVPQSAQRVFVVADPTQGIYQSGFRWKDTGLAVVGRAYSLDHNFRSTVEIMAAAESLVVGSELADDPEILRGKKPRRHGPRPRVISCRALAGEVAWVIDDIADKIRLGLVAPANVAVLARHHDALVQVTQALTQRGLSHRYHDRGAEVVLAAPSVKVMTLHSAKGLEFPVVYIVDINRGRFPSVIPDQLGDDRAAHGLRERKTFYVGMTRAMQELTLTYSVSVPSHFVEELERNLFEEIDAVHGRGGLDADGPQTVKRAEIEFRPGDNVRHRQRNWVELTSVGDRLEYEYGGSRAQCSRNSIVAIRRDGEEWAFEDG